MGFAKSLAKTGMFGLAGLALSGGKKKKDPVRPSMMSGPEGYRPVATESSSLLSRRPY